MSTLTAVAPPCALVALCRVVASSLAALRAMPTSWWLTSPTSETWDGYCLLHQLVHLLQHLLHTLLYRLALFRQGGNLALRRLALAMRIPRPLFGCSCLRLQLLAQAGGFGFGGRTRLALLLYDLHGAKNLLLQRLKLIHTHCHCGTHTRSISGICA